MSIAHVQVYSKQRHVSPLAQQVTMWHGRNMAKRVTPTKLLTPRQVEQRLNINKATLSRWVAAGKITPAYAADGVNGIRLYDPAEVERIATERAAS